MKLRTYLLAACVLLQQALPSAGAALIPIAFPGMNVDGATIISVPTNGFSINDSGQILVSFDSIGQESPEGGKGIWLYGESGLQLVTRAGKVAPGLSSEATFTSFGGIRIGNGGHVAFSATDTSSPQVALWAGLPGNLRLIARQGDVAPGLEGRTYDARFHSIQLDALGGMLFQQGDSRSSSPDLRAAWYKAADAAQPTLIAADGMQAPGTQADYFSIVSAVVNDVGNVAFYAEVGDTRREGIWSWNADAGLNIVAGADSLEPNIRVFSPSHPRITSDGTIVFTAYRRDPITTRYSHELWERDEAGLRSVSLVPWPGDWISPPEISSTGKMVFARHDYGSLIPHNLSVFDGQNEPNEVAPGQVGRFTGFYMINSSGRVVVEAIDEDGRSALWTLWADGSRELIVKEGDSIELNGVTKTIDMLSGNWNTLSDNDRLVFQIVFTDGTTATMLAVVPEPSGVGIVMVLGTLGMLRRRVTIAQQCNGDSGGRLSYQL